jgi:predicted nucleotidyltransferase
MEHLSMYAPESALLELQCRLGRKWSHLVEAKERAVAKRNELRQVLVGKDSDDTSIVVFGSLARDEFTNGSDIDWTLLIDGFADPQHLNLVREIREIARLTARKSLGQRLPLGAWHGVTRLCISSAVKMTPTGTRHSVS